MFPFREMWRFLFLCSPHIFPTSWFRARKSSKPRANFFNYAIRKTPLLRQAAWGASAFATAGLFLLVAVELHLRPADFDPNLPPSLTGISRETALRQILVANFSHVVIRDAMHPDFEVRDALQIGDLHLKP